MLLRDEKEHATPDWRSSEGLPAAPLHGVRPSAGVATAGDHPAHSHGLLRRTIRVFDAILRRLQGVFEFTTHPDCVLRLELGRTTDEIRLASTGELAPGTRIADLHLWNEQLPPPPHGGPNFRWVKALHQQVVLSLGELAAYVQDHPGMGDVVAFRARVAFASAGRRRKLAAIAARFGFERSEVAVRPRLGQRLHDFFDDFWLAGLVWTFNPRALRGRALARPREEFWISRATLIARFGAGGGAMAAGGAAASPDRD